ncbi:MAG: GspJ family T2SS minor pseudopilin variant LspJ [Tatlockia sp.]|nr:GspJ family T2SS minor pseudopilin variant LspJ [Tatlockia sp.]
MSNLAFSTHSKQKQQGYTLIEILIALAVFAILATITASSMYYAFETRARVTAQADRLNALQLALVLMERDIEQIVLRNARGKDMLIYPALDGQSKYVEFTRSGFANPNSDEKRSILKRVAYLCQNNSLLRRTWVALDAADRKAYQDKILLTELTHCEFSYLNSNVQNLSEIRASAVQPNQRAEPLPKAIQMNLTLNHWGNINYLFVIPGSLYAES